MLSLAIPAWNIALRTAVVYLVVLVGMRLAGTRGMGQMTIFDLVLLLLIANAVQNAMVGPDTSLAGELLAASQNSSTRGREHKRFLCPSRLAAGPAHKSGSALLHARAL